MTTRPRFRLPAALLAGLLLAAVAGCGADDEPTGAAPATTVTEATTAPEVDRAPEPLARLRLTYPETLAFAAPFELAASRPGLLAVADEVALTPWASPDVLRTMLVNGEADVAAVPTYVGANLSNRGVDVRLVAVVVWGLLHLLGPEGTPADWEALRGETVHVPFPGDMPDLVFRYLAEANGLTVGEDFEIEHHAQPLEIVALLASGKARWAVLPEHVATLALRNAGQAGFPVARVVDLQAAWGEATGTEPRIPQAGIVMPAELVESRPDVVAAVQREVAAAVEAITSDPAAVAPGLAESSSLPEAVVADVIPRLNLDVVSGADARAELERFFGELHDRSPDVIGGRLPGDEFYVPTMP